jgi:hypothetical protein
MFERVAAKWPNVSAYFPGSIMCENENCMTKLNGEFLYRDAGHIRRNLTERTRMDLARILHLDEIFRPIPSAKVADALAAPKAK